ncbi:MAG: CHAT domain-containing protein, partial [Actinomycetota bacterium]
ARTAFRRQQRPGWVALASHATVRAGWLDGSRSPAGLRRALRTADALSGIGWAVPALDARLLAARHALALGRTETATKELARASRARRSGPVELRMRAWHAEALLRLSRGDHRGADTALRTGVRILNQHRAALGATELRVHASGHGAELAKLGLSLAISSGRPERVLKWMERWRAGTLLLRPARPPEDAVLAHELAELRRVGAELDTAVLAGRRPDALLRRQAALEGAIRRRSWQAPGSGALTERPAVGAGSVAEALGERALVEIAEEQGALWAVALAGGKLRLRRLGALSEVTSEIEALRFALRRLALGGPDRLLQVAGDGAVHAARRLDDLLLAPLASHVAERPLVIVPTGPLHAIPWSLLPSCSGRPVTVAPSAGLWMEAMKRALGPTSATGVVLVAGPDLAGAKAEVAALKRRYPRAIHLQGEDARVEEVTRSLDGAKLAHLATHGRFRADNPLFSSLQLADGPLMVYDLERLDSAPRLVVLSACDSGLSGVRPGDELMGLASALFALGAATLVASVVPVPDEATHALMLEFHRGLKLRLPPATALMAAQMAVGSPSPTKLAAGAGFVCFGAS